MKRVDIEFYKLIQEGLGCFLHLPEVANKRKGTKFIKKAEKSDEAIKIVPFADGLIELGQTYVKFLDIKKAGDKLDGK